MHLLSRLDAVGHRHDVLRHPFYRRWSAGTLKREELAFYAGEYRHAVVALAAQSEAAAADAEPALRSGLAEHAREETAHIELWDRFARGVEADTTRAPLTPTRACTEAWTDGQGLLERLAVLYAVESAQPAISRTKLDGLADHYGFKPDDPAAAYFAVHAERDVEHAAAAAHLIAERIDGADEDRLLALAECALRGNWALLDGVEERFAA